MAKIDICREMFYIQKLILVIHAGNPRHHKLFQSSSRYSDAFVYILSGSCTYGFDDGQEFTVHPGEILYLAHQAVYTMYIHSEDYRYVYCDFQLAGAELRRSAVYTVPNPADTEKLFFRLLRSFRAGSEDSLCESMAYLYQIYGLIRRTANREYIGNSAKNRIAKVKEYMDTHYHDCSMSISDLAEEANMSQVYLRKLFKHQYDVSPARYMVSLRLRKALELMQYPFLSLEDCALQSGFSSLQYFCRVFRQEMGETPAKYRKKAEDYANST